MTLPLLGNIETAKRTERRTERGGGKKRKRRGRG